MSALSVKSDLDLCRPQKTVIFTLGAERVNKYPDATFCFCLPLASLKAPAGAEIDQQHLFAKH